ncbi:MAG: DUF370 domain-containing protein [Nitrospinae bacterium]|nr:DUF370 domain-containing protein [Nitrospinota bacterium]
MPQKLIDIGFKNVVVSTRVVAILASGSAPIKRLRNEARDKGKLLDATHGRQVRSILVTDSDHIILSSVKPDTLAQRYSNSDNWEKVNKKSTSWEKVNKKST